ncbi:RNA polymerase sigma factor, partial [[Clostridium] innocuum]
EELIRRLYEAISSLPPMQARRVHARYMLGMKVKDIAAMEGITPSQAGKSIHAALRRLRRYFARQKWTVNL